MALADPKILKKKKKKKLGIKTKIYIQKHLAMPKKLKCSFGPSSSNFLNPSLDIEVKITERAYSSHVVILSQIRQPKGGKSR